MNPLIIPIAQPDNLAQLDEDLFCIFDHTDPCGLRFQSRSRIPFEANQNFQSLDELFSFHWPNAPVSAMAEWMALEWFALALALNKHAPANESAKH